MMVLFFGSSNMTHRHNVLLILATFVAGFVPSGTALCGAETEGWRDLLAGGDLSQWQNAAGQQPNSGWVLDDGVLARKGRGGYIWSKDRFGDFVLELEFKTEGNSGVFIRTDNLKNPVQTGLEIQILSPVDKPTKGSCGAVYNCLAPTKEMSRAGEWNKMSIRALDNELSVTINGEKIVDMDLNRWTEPHRNPDGTQNKFSTPIKDFKREGHIGFQDHGHPVAYRNARIKPLKSEQ